MCSNETGKEAMSQQNDALRQEPKDLDKRWDDVKIWGGVCGKMLDHVHVLKKDDNTLKQQSQVSIEEL